MPLPATLHAPAFLRFEHVELQALLNQVRDPLCVHLFLLIASQADFATGELNTSYARLIELCTPPKPERGRRMAEPSIDQVRRALTWLIEARLVKRDAARNEAQGTLRLYVRKRIKPVRAKARPAD